jgi:hypothetical protein
MFATIGIVLFSVSPAVGQLRPAPGTLDLASPELIDRLRSDPFNYFRFVNRPWIARVCDVFAQDLRDVPIVRLHGDAHVEQFALTQDAWGLDDFDDSARGPAVVDIMRFLGSIDIATRQRGWTRNREALFDRFLEGYRKGLAEPQYRPPEPDIVRQLRVQPSRSRAAFLVWGETLMEPMGEMSLKAVDAAMEEFGRFIYPKRPDLAPGYLLVSRAGWLRMGVGSAVVPKVLIRVQGPSTDPADDELLEGKELTYLGGLKCLETPPLPPSVRVIAGNEQIGRLRHNILAAGPELVIPDMAPGRQLRDWWIRSWEPSYQEVRLKDLRSVNDLAAIVYDSGVQLGSGSMQEQTGQQGSVQKRALASIARLEQRMRQEASRLVEQLLLGWRELGGR